MKFSKRVVFLFIGIICFIYFRSVLYPLYQNPGARHLRRNDSIIRKIKNEDPDYIERAALVRLITQEIGNATGENNTLASLKYAWKVIKELRKNKVLNMTLMEEDSEEEVAVKRPRSTQSIRRGRQLYDVSKVLQSKHLMLNWTGVKLPFKLPENERKKDVELLRRVIGKMKLVTASPRPVANYQPLYGETEVEGPEPSWQYFHNHINARGLYAPDDPGIDRLLHDMANKKITAVEQKSGGTQLKLRFTLEDDAEALFKPMRFPREVGTKLNHYYFSDYERHTAEIAAFHLDRLLLFGRAPPVVGRKINITRDVLQHAGRSLAKTFFFSPVGNLCFYGKCSYYCDTDHAFCGNPDQIEGSMAALLPPEELLAREGVRHPWRRSYSKRKRATWEDDLNYCDTVRVKPPYNKGRRLLDLMDLATYDFLTGNLDRHHYEVATQWGNDTYLIHWDHGRAFGRSGSDYLSCLAPVYQCCLYRYSTLKTLLHYYSGPISLGSALKLSLKKDPLNPILLDDHFQAVDRRVAIILQTIYKCILKTKNITSVIKDDGF